MAPLSNHITLSISATSTTVARAGFGVPLVLSATASFAERVRSYANLAAVAVDFATTTSAEYLAAQALFAQNPRPSSIKIGRSALPPTQVYEFTPTAINSHEYKINVRGDGITEEEVSFTSDASATVAEITAGLTTQLNGVTGKNYTAVDNTTKITITATAAGDWFSLKLLDVADGKIEQTHIDPGIATDLAAIQVEDDAWYCLITLYNSNAYVLAAAAWIEAQKKIYVPDVSDSESITAVVTSSDTIDDIKTSAYTRTMGTYHPEPGELFAAAWAGKVLPLQPGSGTWKYKTLAGVDPVTMTSTQRANLIAKSGNSYETVSGVNITFEGTTGDADFLDVRRGLDWLEDDMSAGVFGALAGASKIPFTNPGIAVIEAEVKASLERAVNKGILAADPAPTVTVPDVSDVSAANKTARTLTDITFAATLAGAIHKTTITGVVSV